MIEKAPTLRDKSILALYYITGVRAKEPFSIMKEDIWKDDKFLYVRIKREKVRKDVVVPMPSVLPIALTANHLQLIISQWESTAPAHQVWFYADNPETARKYVWKMIKNVNPNAWTHLFRHTRNEYFRGKGKTREQRMGWFGWTDSRTPDKYTHPNEKDVKDLGSDIE